MDSVAKRPSSGLRALFTVVLLAAAGGAAFVIRERHVSQVRPVPQDDTNGGRDLRVQRQPQPTQEVRTRD
jgi:hypothetical protein